MGRAFEGLAREIGVLRLDVHSSWWGPSPRDSSDERLLARARRGDEASAAELWRRVGGVLRAYARAAAPRGVEGDDLVQAALVALLRLPTAEVDACRSAMALLTTLVRRQALMAARAQQRRRGRERASSLAASLRHGPQGMPMGSDPPEADAALWRALDGLPRRDREVLVLRAVVGLSFERIALVLGVPKSTAADRHAAALRHLRRSLEQPSPADATTARAQHDHTRRAGREVPHA